MLACRGMTTSDVKKRVLLIGLDPKVVDFAAVPGMDEAGWSPDWRRRARPSRPRASTRSGA